MFFKSFFFIPYKRAQKNYKEEHGIDGAAFDVCGQASVSHGLQSYVTVSHLWCLEKDRVYRLLQRKVSDTGAL